MRTMAANVAAGGLPITIAVVMLGACALAYLLMIVEVTRDEFRLYRLHRACGWDPTRRQRAYWWLKRVMYGAAHVVVLMMLVQVLHIVVEMGKGRR